MKKLEIHSKQEPQAALFRVTTESALLYGAVSWTMTEQLEGSLDGAYTRLLCYTLNVH